MLSESDKAEESKLSATKNAIVDLMKSPVQMLFACCALIAIVGVVPFIICGYLFRQKAIANKPEGYNFPGIDDFKYCLVSACIIGVIDVIIYNITFKLF